MTKNSRELLEVLRFELNYLEQGGFNRDRALLGTESPFQGSYACINFDDPLRTHACHECMLYAFVPENKKTEDLPCHHILLDDSGETVAKFIEKNDPLGMVEALEHWLRVTISRLEATSAGNGESSN